MNLENMRPGDICRQMTVKDYALLFSLLGIAYGAGLLYGQYNSENKTRAEILDLKNKIQKLEIERDTSNIKIAGISKANEQWQHAYKELQDKSNPISAKEPKTQINCDFIHKQMEETKKDMERPNLAALFGASTSTAEAAAEEKHRKTVLEGRLSEYIKQLSSCDK